MTAETGWYWSGNNTHAHRSRLSSVWQYNNCKQTRDRNASSQSWLHVTSQCHHRPLHCHCVTAGTRWYAAVCCWNVCWSGLCPHWRQDLATLHESLRSSDSISAPLSTYDHMTMWLRRYVPLCHTAVIPLDRSLSKTSADNYKSSNQLS